MMKNRLIYVELKTGYGDSGPAWIGIAGASKTGSTIYFNGMAFRSLKGSGIGGNYFNIETGDEYWISGIKKNNKDRHWAGGGEILIDKLAVKAYLKETEFHSLPNNIKTTTLEPASQQSEHETLEHRSARERSEQFQDSIPYSRASAIKRKG